jgi:hypothetical protein
MGIGWDWFGKSVRLYDNIYLLLDNNLCLLLDKNMSFVGLCLLLDIILCGYILLNWDIG